MHDPMTVAFEIRYPWVSRRNRNSTSKFLRTYRDSFITIWHVDPEKDGSDDSCDWFYSRLGHKEQAIVSRLLDNPDDNLRGYFTSSDDDHVRWLVGRIVQNTSRTLRPRPWWQHPHWHIWHWRFQVHPYQKARRWLFTRCATCGGRFGWNESPCALGWHDRAVHHMRCVGVEPAREVVEALRD